MNNNLQNNFQNTEAINPKLKWWLSWPFIIVAFIFFWPAALFLIWKRTTIDKKASILSGNILTLLGYVSLAIIALGIFVSIFQGFKSNDVRSITFFLFAGVGLLLLGRKVNANAEKSKKYISIIVNNGIIDIDNIAATIPTSYAKARNDLQNMINKGFFQGAYINDSERQIVLPNRHEGSSSNENSTEKTSKVHVVTCNSCGAQNSIASGSVGECEYCGSKIEG